jgi:hypothetical protein
MDTQQFLMSLKIRYNEFLLYFPRIEQPDMSDKKSRLFMRAVFVVERESKNVDWNCGKLKQNTEGMAQLSLMYNTTRLIFHWQ